jgi:hypothetical protein
MRRLILFALAVFLAFGGLAFAEDGHTCSMVGTWLVNVTFLYPDNSTLVFRYLQTFNADGVTTAVVPDVAPGFTDARSACVGEWKPTPSGRIEMVTYCLEDSTPTGWLDKISARFKVSRDGMHVSDPHFSAEWWLGDTYYGIGYGSMEGVKVAGGLKH